MQKYIVNFVNEKKIVSVDYGMSIMSAAQGNGIAIANNCGGRGLCGACRVKILRGSVSSVTDVEKSYLTAEDLEAGFRLACEAKVLGDVLVQTTCAENSLTVLSGVLPYEISKIMCETPALAVALDLGTTSIALVVFDLVAGRILGSASFANPQAPFGSDVMSRIDAISRDAENLKKMQEILLSALSNSLQKIVEATDLQKIKKIVVSANTVMQHIMFGVSPQSMGNAPYKPSFLCHAPIEAQKIGLPLDEAKIYLIPIVSAFIGGDTTSGLVALDLDCAGENETSLFIDLGTNNEMALVSNGHILATSTAAGPAFEGAGISQGMRAESGAICSLDFADNTFTISTIGDGVARGICGSGMIDCLATFLKQGIMKPSGSLNSSSPFVTTNKIGVLQVEVAENVHLTQKDIRALQLVIAGVKAGIKILLKKSGLSEQSLNKIYLAGGFGNFINIKNALQIGLLPNCNANVISVKNTSLLGAIRAIWETDFLPRALRLSQRVETINLALEADFEEIFMASLDFDKEQ